MAKTYVPDDGMEKLLDKLEGLVKYSNVAGINGKSFRLEREACRDMLIELLEIDGTRH